jgi:hypothetical protein
MIIGIDFDGTCVTHAFPEVGEDIGAEPILKRLVKRGHKLVLWTVRSNQAPYADSPDPKLRDYLYEAVKWFADRDIPLYGINENPKQGSWSSSRKAYCELYIDDAALGCPLAFDAEKSQRLFADWNIIEEYLLRRGIL